MKLMRTPFKLILTGLVAVSLHIGCSAITYAGEVNEIEAVESEMAKSPGSEQKWATQVQTKYHLTDDQMNSLHDGGIRGSQLAITAELAKASGKSTGEIMAMRMSEKMGWGKIAKSLDVPPAKIGQSVASLHREITGNNEENQEKNADKTANKHAGPPAEKMTEKKGVKREERKKLREESKLERQDPKAEKVAHPGIGH